MRNQKVINILLALLLSGLILGCSNAANNDDKNSGNDKNNDVTEKILWEETLNGYKEKVLLSEVTKDDIKTKSLAYSIIEEASGKGLGFGISKIESNGNRIYKGFIAAKKTTEAFEESFWNQYKISCGQSTIIMSNAISGPNKEDEDFEFMIMGGLSESQIEALKNANELVITLQNSDNSNRNTTFACDYTFVINLIKHF